MIMLGSLKVLMSPMPRTLAHTTSIIAYFSMEVAVRPAIPTYNGGLGILAGDTLRAAADLSVPMIGMTLLYRKGFFRQHLDERGNQTENSVLEAWLHELQVFFRSPQVDPIFRCRLPLVQDAVGKSPYNTKVSCLSWVHSTFGLAKCLQPVS